MRLKQKFFAWRQAVKQKHPDETALALRNIEAKDSEINLLDATDEQLKTFISTLSCESFLKTEIDKNLYKLTIERLLADLPEKLKRSCFYLVLAERIARYQVLLNNIEYNLFKNYGLTADSIKESPTTSKYIQLTNEWRKCMELFGNQRWADEKKIKEDVVKALRELRNTPPAREKTIPIDISAEARREL